MSKRGKKHIWKAILTGLVWALIVAFFVGAAILRSNNEQSRRVKKLTVEITDSARNNLISKASIEALVMQAGLNPVGLPIDSVSLLAINNLVEEYCFTRSAQTFVDYDGVVTIRLTQREPIARVITNQGRDFYLTVGAHVLPTHVGEAINLPLITGDLEVPFPKNFKGDLRAWASANKKNSDKNYKFILKLINFVRLLEEYPEVGQNVVQVVLTKAPSSGPASNPEPRVELVPREGNYLVQIGSLEHAERKLDQWRRFVAAGVVNLNEEGVLNVSFDGQAVWKKAEAPDKEKAKKRK